MSIRRTIRTADLIDLVSMTVVEAGVMTSQISNFPVGGESWGDCDSGPKTQ